MLAKRVIFLGLLFLSLVLFTGCGGEPGTVEDEPEVQPAVTQQSNGEAGKNEEPSISVEGNLEHPYEFIFSDFAGQEITITAQFVGCSKTLPPREYKGIPVSVILNKSIPKGNSVKLTIDGTDGYNKTYVLEDVLKDKEMILTNEDGLQIIAGDGQKYDASYWVRDVIKMVVE
ncbi:MAG: hypothetical protein U9N81_03250 [Bacillota bacterium]|nr:hypothetical protein [Bacillota bacterium]